MRNIRQFKARSWWLALALCMGCATSSRSEKSNSAAPPAPPAPLAEQQTGSTELNTDRSAERARAPESPAAEPEAAATPPAFATPPSRSKAEKPTAQKKSTASPAPAAAPKRATAGQEASVARDLLQEPLRPTSADPPQLRTALLDLLNAADELSAGHSCDDGCKAFQSMQRAASRICDLTPTNDPLSRCASARSRVSAANQDLQRRCGSCPK